MNLLVSKLHYPAFADVTDQFASLTRDSHDKNRVRR
jgi:hypothetical protein